MTDPQQSLQALIQGGMAEQRFPPTSRYHGLPVAVHEAPDGTTHSYLKRRLVPATEEFETMREEVVGQGERVDQLAARLIGDPEMFWQLCDANGVLDPGELEEAGRTLRVTLPQGIAGGGAGA